MVGQGRCHRSGSDIRYGHMVGLLDHTDHVCDADLGFGTQSIAHIGGIQHPVDMAEPYGLSAALGLTAVLS